MTEDVADSGLERTHALGAVAPAVQDDHRGDPPAGLELRVSYGSEPNLLDSDVSDDSEAREWRADTLRGVLEANGWKRVAAR